MANIARRSDRTWRARYRDARGKEHARHFNRKLDAQRWLDSVATAVGTGTYVDPRDARIKFGDWAPRWLATTVNLKQTTQSTYENLLRNHVLSAWHEVALGEISHELVAGWLADLTRRGLSASTIRQVHRVFSLALELAVQDGRLARNPAAGAPLPRAVPAEHVYLTHAQVEALASEAGQYRIVVLFLAYTGVRFGELAALRIDRLDLLRRRATIAEAVAEVHGKAVFSSPKNHQSRRVSIPKFLIDDLAVLVAGRDADEFVFTSPRGGLLRLRNFRRNGFEPAVAAAGLTRITPHGLRHTAASLAIAAGANVKVVQSILGHKSATMTLDLYGHLFENQLDEVADALDSARAAADFLRTEPVSMMRRQRASDAIAQ